jgi:hypothetical protein
LRLALLAMAAFLLVVVSCVGAVGGLLALNGTRVDPTTTELVLLGALAAMSAFPAVVAIRKVRRQVWANTARVVDYLQALKGPMLSGLCSYGLAAMVVRFGDELLARPTLGSLLGRPPGVAYRGYSIALPLIGLLGAFAFWCHRRWWRPTKPVRRWIFGPVLSFAAALGGLAIMYTAVSHRAANAIAVQQPQSSPPATVATTPTIAAIALAPETQRAPVDELGSAVAEGADGLRVLSERYPTDPAVLKALVMAFASRSNRLLEAVEATRRLLLIAPERETDPDLHYLVRQAASESGKASELAFVVMSQHMGKAGADLLYALMLDRPEFSTRAKIALESLRRGGRFSPELAIAYDLRFAPSCGTRLGLLPRALELGDRRSAHILSGLARRPPGCKTTKQRTCKPRCADEAKQFARAAQALYERNPTSK